MRSGRVSKIAVLPKSEVPIPQGSVSDVADILYKQDQCNILAQFSSSDLGIRMTALNNLQQSGFLTSYLV